MSDVVTNCTEEVYSKLLPEVKNEICKLSGNYGGTIEIKIGDRVTKLKSKAIHEKFDTVFETGKYGYSCLFEWRSRNW